MGLEGHVLKKLPRWWWIGNGRRTRRSAAARWRRRMWLEAPRRARRRVPSRRRGARTVAQLPWRELPSRARARESWPAFCRSEVVDRESGEREGVVGGSGVQRDD